MSKGSTSCQKPENNFVSAKQVTHKWKNLRDYFRKELKKVPLPRSGDPGEEALKKSTWPHFKSLLFLKDQFLPRTSHSNLPDTDEETMITTISTPGEVNDGENEGEEEDISQEIENLSEGVKEIDEFSTPSLPSGSEPRTILTKRCRKRTSDMDALLELERQKMKLWREKHARQIPPTTNTTPVSDEDKSFFESLLPHVRQIQPRLKLRFRNEIQNLVQNYVYEEEYNASAHSRIPYSIYPPSAAETSSVTPHHVPQQLHNSSSPPILQTPRTPHLLLLESVEASNPLNTYNFQHSSDNNIYPRRD